MVSPGSLKHTPFRSSFKVMALILPALAVSGSVA
jgi:hypothetical protein